MCPSFSALEGNADIAIGNAVGSVTANTGLIMCLSLICMECTMPRRQYAVKAVLLLAAIAVLFGFTRDGQLSILESVLILVIFVCFIAESLVAARREQSLEAPEQDARPKTDGRTVALNIGKFVFGAAAIVLGAQLLIDNGTALAQMIGVPDAIIGATMIAIGTSLPELVTTITAIRKKQSSLSVGNIIGANIMDLTLIMPLCALILGKPLPVERQGMLLDIPACLVVCAGALIPALVQGRFKRWVGFFHRRTVHRLSRHHVHVLRRVKSGGLPRETGAFCCDICCRQKKPRKPKLPGFWCARRDLNPHVRSGH